MRWLPLLLCAFAAVASANEDDADRKFAIRKAELRLKLAADVAGYAKEALADADKLVDAGMLPRGEYAAIGLRADEASAERDLRALDLANSSTWKASSADPRRKTRTVEAQLRTHGVCGACRAGRCLPRHT
jgi:hypothetical protein